MENDFDGRIADAQSESDRAARAQAETALAELARDRERLAARIITPWWYHPALGLITAVFAGAQALPGVWPIAATALGIIALPVLTTTYARVSGVVVTKRAGKPAGPRSRRLLIATLAVFIAAMSCSLAFKFLDVSPWWALIPAGVMFAATVVLGRRYDEALRQEIATPRITPA